MACLRLYAAAITAVLEGVSVLLFDGSTDPLIALRLVVFGAAVAVSIHELNKRRKAH